MADDQKPHLITKENAIIDILNRGVETARFALAQRTASATSETGGVVTAQVTICPLLYIHWE